MAEMLKYIFNASINGGPSKSIKDQLEMNTYDVVNITVTAGAEKEVTLLPVSAGIKFFCIESDHYSSEENNDPATAELVYKIGSNLGTSSDIPIILNRPHVLIGKSIIDKIGNFSALKIKNGGGSDTTLRIMVGRDV